MSLTKQNLLSIGLICIVVGIACLLLVHLHAKQVSDTTSTTQSSIQFEVVTSPQAQMKGLGGRTNIPHNYAMLFVFPTDNRYGFWMKDMLVPIDIVWLSDNGTVLKVDASTSPSTYPKVFYPPQPVRYVLETRAGFAYDQNWNIGTHISLPLPYGK